MFFSKGELVRTMTRQELAKALGGHTRGPWINIPGPGHSKHDRSLGFSFDPKTPSGIRIFSLAGDDPVICRIHVLSLLEKLKPDDPPIMPAFIELEDQANNKTRIVNAMRLWEDGLPADGTIVQTYLASRKCLLVPISAALRFHPSCPWGPLRVPAMIALMCDVVTGEPTGIHRTALSDDGSGKRKLPSGTPTRMMMGRSKRAAVMLSGVASHLGIAEGIETTLSSQKLFGIPAWACLSAQGIASFPIINGLDRLTIFADHDDAGIAAAHTCGARYFENSIVGEIQYPSVPGADWNCNEREGK